MNKIQGWILLGGILAASCQPGVPAPAAVPTTKSIIPSEAATGWQLKIQVDQSRNARFGLIRTLAKVSIGHLTIQGLREQIGDPRQSKAMPDGIGLLYPSEWELYPNTVVVNGVSGLIQFMAIENVSLPDFNLRNLREMLGEPEQAFAAETSPSGLEHLFFPKQGCAVLIDRRFPAQVLYLQKFSKEISLETYRGKQGYWPETSIFFSESSSARPGDNKNSLKPVPGGLSDEPQRIEFKSIDGTPLVGTYYPGKPDPAPVVVLFHWRGGSKADWDQWGLVEWLRNRRLPNPAAPKGLYPALPENLSFAVFAFDYRGHGESGWINDDPNGWLLDGAAAMETARDLPGVDPNRMITIGASIGADGAIDACGVGCLGALSLTPRNYMNVPYHLAVAALDFEGKPAWCLASVLDVGCPPRAMGEHYRSIVYVGQNHGMQLLTPDLVPNPGEEIREFLMTSLKVKK